MSEVKGTRFWVMKNDAGEYYTPNGPPYWVPRQVDAFRYNEETARMGARIGRRVRAVRVFKRINVTRLRPCTTSDPTKP